MSSRSWRLAVSLGVMLAAGITRVFAEPPADTPVTPAVHEEATPTRLPAVAPASAARVAELESRLEELERLVQDGKKKDTDGKVTDDTKGAYEVGSDLEMTASWKHGLEVYSKNKDFRVHVGGRTQVDAVWLSALEPEALVNVGGVGVQDAVDFRRARLRVDATMYETMDFACEYDFVNSGNINSNLPTISGASTIPPGGNINLGAATENTVINVPAPTDLWINIKDLPTVGNVRIGNMKEPLGLEHQNSSRFLDFMERSMLQDAYTGPFNNGFSPGVMIFDNFDDERGLWAIGTFKNTQNAYAFGIGDGEYATTGRITYLPYYDDSSHGRYLVHVGMSGSIRNNDQDRLRIRSRGSLRNGPGALNPVFADTGILASSNESILGAEAAIVAGPWLFQSEYMCASAYDCFGNGTSSIAGASLGTVFTQGYYVQALVFLTGEYREYEKATRASFGRVIPNENFFYVRDAQGRRCVGRGAWQLGVRYSNLDLNDPGVNGGVMHDVTIGLNWFMNPNMKIQFNYDILNRESQGLFAGPAPGGTITGFGMRTAFDF